MFDLDNWQEIWATITRNKLRSFLTGFGVFWGIFMLIILIGAGNSLQGGIYKNFEGFASNSCFFWTGRTSEAYKGYRKGRWWSMNVRDIELIRRKAESVEYISPMLFIGGGEKNAVRGTKSGTYDVRGILPEHFMIEGQHVLSGRLFNELDEAGKRKVCVIGKEVYETLFQKGEDPQGQYIRVNGIYFQVIGVIRPKSRASIGGDVEQSIYLPFSTTQVAFNQGQNIWFMACTAKPGYPASMVEEEVKAIIKASHDISPTDEKAMGSVNIEKQFMMFQNLFMGIDILIWIVGLGALFSGIIGISNIMLVTVKERTREIGVRRAIGAKPMTIMIQILSESFVLTAIAGFGGFLFGVSILEIVYQAMSNTMGGDTEGGSIFIPPFVSFWTAIVAMGILIISGIMAGFMPAMRALKIKAIDAIREE
ncbi:putative ABC transport system permease protein [Dysgonomonas hofstadii]|uniref:Putative ABC transport system permease protein n=1 Tax=Dysgonomonas hofstadii TaxID=637886 RepID=A0A840CPT1_9BACT|nr:ABC transporter permease [Dysgonomonas hofstadii]MBB4038020.1 putative ABC transport system permease protein [Dysgonomonas hofstadii]